jgi:MFS family permease
VEREERILCTSVGFWNVCITGLAFFLLFTSYNSAQMLQAPTQKEHWLASTGVGLVFGAYSICSLIAPNIVEKIGERTGLVVGGSLSVVYLVTNVMLSKFDPVLGLYAPVYLVSSVLNGVGSSLLWTSQGSLITLMCKPETLGTYNGVFAALYMGNFLSGGLLTQFLLGCGGAEGKNEPLTLLYIVFSVLGAAAVAMMFFIRVTTSVMASKKKLSWSPVKTLRILLDRRIRYMFPAIAVSGFSSAFFMVILTAYAGPCFIGTFQVVLGVAEVSGSYLSGRISDKVGRTPVFLAGCVFLVISAIFAAFSQPKQETLGGVWTFFCAYFFYGLGDSTFATQSSAALGLYFPDKAAWAFASYRILLAMVGGLISSIGFTFAYLPSPWGILLPCIIMWVAVICAALSWVYMDLRVESLAIPPKVVENVPGEA